jgi:hypothetical protein
MKVFLLLCPFVKMSDDEDDDKSGNPDGDIENEKLSQTMDNPSDKPGAPRCRLRSGTLLFNMCYMCRFILSARL